MMVCDVVTIIYDVDTIKCEILPIRDIIPTQKRCEYFGMTIAQKYFKNKFIYILYYLYSKCV